MAMAAECTGGTPYFPVACAPAKPGRSFALGLENSDAVHTAFLGCGGSMDAAETRLVEELSPHVLRIEAAAQKLAAASGWAYLGLDSSVAPGLDSPCLPASFELLGVGRFGALGTLSAVAAVTAALKKLPCQLVGYCGLMLPLCEDTGLAAAGKQGELRVADLVLFSAVCGCGIDTVPVPGNGSGEAADAANLRGLAALLLDIATLAHRLKKPLSVRVLPCPGKRPGEATSFTSPYLVDSCVLPLASGGTQ